MIRGGSVRGEVVARPLTFGVVWLWPLLNANHLIMCCLMVNKATGVDDMWLSVTGNLPQHCREDGLIGEFMVDNFILRDSLF